MKILLLNPKNFNQLSYVVIPNLGLGYLASPLQKTNNKVLIVDAIRDNLSINQYVEILKKEKVDIVGINVFSSAFESVKIYANATKQINDKIKVVLGGPHPTFEPIETLEQIKTADFGFMGEAETFFPKLLTALKNNNNSYNDIPNLIWRENEKILCNERRLEKDINKIDFPAWHLLEPHKYPIAPNGIFSKKAKISPIIVTRGCPYSCKFCAAKNISGGELRIRKTENVLEEIALLRNEFGIEEIHIMDDNFTFKKEFVQEFCDKLMEKKLNIVWACPNGVRLDTLDRDILQIMEKAGCYSFAVGIESGTQKTLNLMDKSISIETIKEKVSLIKQTTNIKVTGFFLIGFPGEVKNDINKTIDFSISLNLDRANFFNFTPFPGSPIYYSLKEKGQLNDISYDKLYIHRVHYSPESLSKSDLISLQKKAYLKFYLRPRILWNLLKEIKSYSQIKVILRRIKVILFLRTNEYLAYNPTVGGSIW